MQTKYCVAPANQVAARKGCHLVAIKRRAT